MRIAVVGAGAIGGWVAARLALAGHEVSALTGRGPIDTLLLRSGGTEQQARFARFDGPADLVVVATKATALSAAAPVVRSLLEPESFLLPLLNGVPWWFTSPPLRSVDPDGTIGSAFIGAALIGSVVHASARRETDGSVTLAHQDSLILGAPGGGGPHEAVATLFEESGIPVERSADIRRDIWYKLWGNATMNPLSALTGATADRILASTDLRPVILAAMAELARVGAAIGCPIGESGEDRMAVTAKLGAFKTSMLQDVEAGRPIELEALVGAPREIARRVGIPTPTLDQLYATTRLMAEVRGLTDRHRAG